MRPSSSSIALACLVGLVAACAPDPSAAPQAAAPGVALRAEEGARLEEGTAKKLDAALGASVRTERERARDVYRHPRETLAFFGLRDDMKVVELWPGGGYYTVLLAPTLAERGRLTVTHFDPAGDPKSEDTREAKSILDRIGKNPDVLARVAPIQIAAPAFALGPDGSADLVVTFRNVHNWIDEGYADKVFAAIARVLKPGGVLGVEEHRGKPGMTAQQMKDTGYVPEETVIALASAAGLRLDARSEVNANARDTKDYPKGVWSLPPSFAEKELNREKYAAIGESDRMTLRFVKR